MKVSKSLISYNPLQPTRFPGKKYVHIFYSPLLKNTVYKIREALVNGSPDICFYGPAGFGKSYGLLGAYITLRFGCQLQEETDYRQRVLYVNDPSYMLKPGDKLYYRIYFDLIYAFPYHGLTSEDKIKEFLSKISMEGGPNDALDLESSVDKRALMLICRSYLQCAAKRFDLGYFMSSFKSLVMDLSALCLKENVGFYLFLDQVNSLLRPMNISDPVLCNMLMSEIFPEFDAKIFVASGNFQDLSGPSSTRLSFKYVFLLELCNSTDLKNFCAEIDPNLHIDNSMLSYITQICGQNLLEVRLLLTGCAEDAFEDAGEADAENDIVLSATSGATSSIVEGSSTVYNYDFVRDSGILDTSQPDHNVLLQRAKDYFGIRSKEIRSQHQNWWQADSMKRASSKNDFSRALPYLDCRPVPESINIEDLMHVLDGRFMFLMGEKMKNGRDLETVTDEKNETYRLIASSPFIKNEIIKFHAETSKVFNAFSNFFNNMAAVESFKH